MSLVRNVQTNKMIAEFSAPLFLFKFLIVIVLFKLHFSSLTRIQFYKTCKYLFSKSKYIDYTGQQKNFFFQKSLNVKIISGYIKVAEPKYALSFFELALVFEI